jgi:predicted cupin superfamily sugar epimerase
MTTVISHPYSYTTSNTDLIKLLSLQKHPEGGYFNQTLSLQSHIPAKSQSTWPEDLPRSNELGTREHVFVGPAARVLVGEEGEDAQGEESKVDATVIYYLLTPDSYRGRMHMNLHSVRLNKLRLYCTKADNAASAHPSCGSSSIYADKASYDLRWTTRSTPYCARSGYSKWRKDPAFRSWRMVESI